MAWIKSNKIRDNEDNTGWWSGSERTAMLSARSWLSEAKMTTNCAQIQTIPYLYRSEKNNGQARACNAKSRITLPNRFYVIHLGNGFYGIQLKCRQKGRQRFRRHSSAAKHFVVWQNSGVQKMKQMLQPAAWLACNTTTLPGMESTLPETWNKETQTSVIRHKNDQISKWNKQG